jgi:hypothetical protein
MSTVLAVVIAPSILWRLMVKQTTRSSGICTAQLLRASPTPVRLSIRM